MKKFTMCRTAILNSTVLFLVGCCLSPTTTQAFSSNHRALSSTRIPLLSPMVFQTAPLTSSPSTLHMLPHDSFDVASSLLTAVEVFDGSSIVDPVVVSGSFWGSLQRQLISVLLGQFLAAIVFGLVASFFASQISNAKDFIFSRLLDETSNNNQQRPFIRADSPEYSRRVDTVTPDYGRLLICLLIDFVGSANEIIPIVGEFADLVSAPLAAVALQKLFGGSKAIFLFEFAEEILPFTDIIPFATICWVVDTYFPESDIAGIFQLGSYKQGAASAPSTSEAIDTTAEVLDTRDRK